MRNLIAASFTVMAVLGASTVFAGQSDRVVGESLDNGLGALPVTYTGEEFLPRPAGYVRGQKQDSGLGSVSSEELARIVSMYSTR